MILLTISSDLKGMNMRPIRNTATRRVLAVVLLIGCWAVTGDAWAADAPRARLDVTRLSSPLLFHGDEDTAYRDPTAIYHDGVFYLYFTLCTIDPDGLIYLQTATSKSRDLSHWTTPKSFTPKDRAQNFSSPGNVVRDGDDFVLCLQTYPTPQKPTPSRKPGAPRWVVQYGDHNSRLWTMRCKNLENWGKPEMLRVQGPDVAPEKMQRVIDPYLMRDKDDPSRWWCFYKQSGQVRYSWSRDLKTWRPAGVGAGGEKPCVILDRGEYVLFYSPQTGVGVKRSPDMKTWRDGGLLTLGLKDWDWAQGRLSAGFVLDLRREPRVGKALMFFHGSRWAEGDPRGGWANHVSLGIAWSDDLVNWDWPGKGRMSKSE